MVKVRNENEEERGEKRRREGREEKGRRKRTKRGPLKEDVRVLFLWMPLIFLSRGRSGELW